MDCHILYIGILDKERLSHFVSLLPGMNVITGKSSTGKSALIEIFDYCFGSSEFTVPVGVITEYAALYFVCIRIRKTFIILSRSEQFGGKGFIQEFTDEADVHPLKFDIFQMMDETQYMPNAAYIKRISRLLDINITDVDLDIKDRESRHNKAKKGTPSVRSLTSFLLQHQNLIANKHALFYRFDEKTKRDPVIEQFVVFLGLVDGDYFQLMQNIAAKKHQLDSLVRFGLPDAKKMREEAEVILRHQADKYLAASGTKLDIGDWLDKPELAVSLAEQAEVRLDSLSQEHLVVRSSLEEERSILIAERREVERQIRLIDATDRRIQEYQTIAEDVPTPGQGTGGVSYCHFCETQHHQIEDHANRLTAAIEWLNGELLKLRALPLSLAEDRNIQQRKLDENTISLSSVLARLTALDQQVDDLAQKRSHLEVAMKAKLEVIQALRTIARNPVMGIEAEIEALKLEISSLEADIKSRYDVVDHKARIEKRLNELMKDIGAGFEFEQSYKPIELRFSAETFELWAVKDGKNVFLRSMGSGANWLSCHVTLFLALHRYFCELGNKCSIPSILFFDQPSQVYFPAILDKDDEFSPKKMIERSGEQRPREVDEDIRAVENLFSKLLKFCANTKTATGIQPQVIVTDHADKLDLEDGANFGDLVRAKWRGVNDGLIKVSPKAQTALLSDATPLNKDSSVEGAESEDVGAESTSASEDSPPAASS